MLKLFKGRKQLSLQSGRKGGGEEFVCTSNIFDNDLVFRYLYRREGKTGPARCNEENPYSTALFL